MGSPVEAYKYHLAGRGEAFRLNRLEQAAEAEALTGMVKGRAASDLEERFAKALYKNKRVRGFRFQVSFLAGRNLPGEKRVDFVVDDGRLTPVEVDGAFAHKSAAQLARDAVKDILLNEHFRRVGMMPLVRVPGHTLASQEAADRVVRELFS